MVVQTREKRSGHSGSVGLHIGEVNVQQYFPKDQLQIELELDHLRIVCPLLPSFWQDRPEIHDQRLSCWLESKRCSGKLGAQDAPVTMIPSGEASFRLQLMSKEETDHVTTAAPTTAYFSPTVSPAALLERRKHKTLQNVERRRLGRLKGDDRPSASAHD
jgi:hypothetical protein